MIARAHRFHGHGSLRRVYQHGGSQRVGSLAIKYMPNQRSNYRAAVVISKKVTKSAVKRNRVRRRIYEQVRLLAPRMQEPQDIVITVFAEDIATMPAAAVKEAIDALLKKAHII